MINIRLNDIQDTRLKTISKLTGLSPRELVQKAVNDLYYSTLKKEFGWKYYQYGYSYCEKLLKINKNNL